MGAMPFARVRNPTVEITQSEAARVEEGTCAARCTRTPNETQRTPTSRQAGMRCQAIETTPPGEEPPALSIGAAQKALIVLRDGGRSYRRRCSPRAGDRVRPGHAP